MTLKTAAIIFAHAIIGWAMCGGMRGEGMVVKTLDTALVVHLVAAPVFIIGVCWVLLILLHQTIADRHGLHRHLHGHLSDWSCGKEGWGKDVYNRCSRTGPR